MTPMHACGTHDGRVKKIVWTRELKGKYKILHVQVLPHISNTYLSLSVNNDAPHYSFIYNIYSFSLNFCCIVIQF
jgi:CTP synthase (UTP-ammonia lyase)